MNKKICEKEKAAVDRLLLDLADVPLCLFTFGLADDMEEEVVSLWTAALDSVGYDYKSRCIIWAAAYNCGNVPAPDYSGTLFYGMRKRALEGGLESSVEAWLAGVPLEDIVA